jgi:hypothetical protein
MEDVTRNGIFAIRAKDKYVPITPGVAAVAHGEGAVTLRRPGFLRNEGCAVPTGLGSCCKRYPLTLRYLIRLTEKMLQLLTVFLQYVDEP